MFKKGLLIVLLSLSILALTAAMPEPEGHYRTFEDSYGRIVNLPESIDRIVSLAPSVTETLYALGLGDKIVGVTEYCNYPAAALSVPKIGDLIDPSVEVIYDLQPDLVIASTHNTRETVDMLGNLGVRTIVITNEDTIAGVLLSIADIARATGREDEGRDLIADLLIRIEAVKQAVAGRTPPRVYYVISYGEYGDFTAGSDTFINELIETAGGENVVKSKGWSYSIEQLIIDDPDMLICPDYEGFSENLLSTSGYNLLSAVKTNSIYKINNDVVDRQGPRIAEAVERLARILHPQVFVESE